eukprot:gene22201-8754_t
MPIRKHQAQVFCIQEQKIRAQDRIQMMIKWCNEPVSRCRRTSLLGYFGEQWIQDEK